MEKSTGVVLKQSYDRMKKRWLVKIVLTNFFYIILIGFLGVALLSEKASLKQLIEKQGPAVEGYKLKSVIYEVLRPQGISLGQGMDIAQIVVDQCRELDLPPGLVLALMKNESGFSTNAKSNKGAMGIMQVMPATWDEYVKKWKSVV